MTGDAVVGPADARTDAPRRFAATDIPGGRLSIRLTSGRVELGSTSGASVRVRATLPRALPDRLRALVPAALRFPRYRWGKDSLLIRARRARLQIDLPPGIGATVKLDRGEITSWGAGGELDLVVRAGGVTCRELRASVVNVRAPNVSLHFAAAPVRVEVDADRVVVALPASAYAVSAPDASEITVSQDEAAACVVIVRAAQARVLAAADPLRLTGEDGAGS